MPELLSDHAGHQLLRDQLAHGKAPGVGVVGEEDDVAVGDQGVHPLADIAVDVPVVLHLDEVHGGPREELDLLRAGLEGDRRPLPRDQLVDRAGERPEPVGGIAALLDVPVGPAVQGVDHDPIASRLHQEDERELAVRRPDDREEGEDLVGGRIRDHDVDPAGADELGRLRKRARRDDRHLAVAGEGPPGLVAPGGVVVVVEDRDHPLSGYPLRARIYAFAFMSRCPCGEPAIRPGTPGSVGAG